MKGHFCRLLCLLAILLQTASAEDQPASLEELRMTTAARDKIGLGGIVYLARRTDGSSGTGTESDPYDASTAPKFDALMAGFHTLFAERSLTIKLGPGLFLTKARDSYGPNAGGNFGAQHWLHANWTLQGSGMFATEIRNANPNGNGVTMFNSSGGTWGGAEEGQITISDLTLNPQRSAFCDRAPTESIPIAGDGKTATGTKAAHGWSVGDQIRVSNATENAFKGVYYLSAKTPDTFSFPGAVKGTATATVQRSGQWTAVRLNGGNLKLFRVRAIDCGSSAPERECWPLWLGSGERNTVDECVVEACSGHMSSISIFPGTHPLVRNCRVDGTGCDGSIAISANAGTITQNYVKNASYAIYADSFSNDEGTLIQGNVIEGASYAGIYVRPNNHHRTIIITDNIVKGGAATIGIGVDPLSASSTDPPIGWLNARGEKVWIEDVTIANNSVGGKNILLAQVRGAKIVDNTAGSGVFYAMKGEPLVRHGNRTTTGEVAMGLEDDSASFEESP